jgi:hypothetical protein
MLGVDQEPRRYLVGQAPHLQVNRPDIQVLFAEARRRRRRRRLLGAAVSLILAGAVIAGVIAGGGAHGGAMRSSDGERSAATMKSQASRLLLPSARLAWLDNGILTMGDPVTGAIRTGPAVDAGTSAPLVFAAGRLYWADANRDRAPVREYNLATGKIGHLQPGEAVFASSNGRHLYIARSISELLELPADGSGRPVVLRAPAGWYMSGLAAGWIPTQAAGAIIVYSSPAPDYVEPTARAGLWNPATGRVRILGVGTTIFGAYTPRGSRYSLVAWVPPGRKIALDYSLRITNTSTGATVVVHSPLHHGFAASGAPAFSPGGKLMAVFVRTGRLGYSNGLSRLAIVDTRTGAVRLVPGAALDTTEDAFWAIWLPDSQQILAGALGSAYLVDARTLAVRPFTYFGSSTDGFSAVVLPVRHEAERGTLPPTVTGVTPRS